MMAMDDAIHAANLAAFMRATVIEDDKRSQERLLTAIDTIDSCMEELRKVTGIRGLKATEK